MRESLQHPLRCNCLSRAERQARRERLDVEVDVDVDVDVQPEERVHWLRVREVRVEGRPWYNNRV
jgi:hypothetical protein